MSRYYMYKEPHGVVFAKTYDDLYNNHTTTFDGINIGAGWTRHTSLDWFLVPKERPSIDKASVKERYIDIPGMNGGLDLTESLTGFPLYDYIEGSFEFTVLNDRKLIKLDDSGNLVSETEISWERLNRDIRDFLNGKERYMMLEDDPSWYYVGRFTVGKYDSSETANSKIEISYKLYPFKKASTYLKNLSDFRETYFDALPLSECDTSELLRSFFNKVYLQLRPTQSKSFNGATRGDLPCGSEAVSVIFYVKNPSNGFIPKVTFNNGVNTITKPIEVETDNKEHSIKVRGVVLTNKGNQGSLYSDDTLTVSLGYPDTYDGTNKAYKKGDCISYTSAQSYIKWILKAKEDIAKGSTLDLSKWEVDYSSNGAMNVQPFDDTQSYAKGKLVYIYDNTQTPPTFTMYKALKTTTVGSMIESEWTTELESLTVNDIYYPVRISLIYDIGVM